MFARQIDPLAAFTSTLSAAEPHHRPDKDAVHHLHHHRHHNLPFTSSPSHSPSSCSGSFHPTANNNNDNSSKKDSTAASSSTYNPYKRKHPLQFEPDFFAALDASLQEFHDDAAQRSDTNSCWKASLSNLNGGSPWPSRPCKRTKNSLSKPPVSSQSTGSISREATLSASSSVRPRMPSLSFNPTQTTTILHNDNTNQNSETESDPPLSYHKSPSFSAWSHRNVFSKSPAFARDLKGPSIIDLSSGEELVPIHLVDNQQHKRRRNSSCEPSSPPEFADSLHQVFELQADGTLLPIQDPSPSDPSPAKRMRLNKANRCQYLHFLSDDESEIDRLSTKMKANLRCRKAHNGFIGSNRAHRTTVMRRTARSGGSASIAAGSTQAHEELYSGANGFWTEQAIDAAFSGISQDQDALSDQEHQMQQEEPSTKGERPLLDSSNTDSQAMVLYKGPKSLSLTPHRQVLDWSHWMDDKAIGQFYLGEAQGHEVVLYQREPIGREPSSQFNRGRSIIWEEEDPQDDGFVTSVLIEELNDGDDDEGNLADDEEYDLSDDASLMDLEEQVTDMDLD